MLEDVSAAIAAAEQFDVSGMTQDECTTLHAEVMTLSARLRRIGTALMEQRRIARVTELRDRMVELGRRNRGNERPR